MTEKLPNNLQGHTNKTFSIGLARAFAGAIIFSFPMLMTMESWSSGITIGQWSENPQIHDLKIRAKGYNKT